MRRTLSLLLAFALLSGLLSACGGRPQPSPEPSASSPAPLFTPDPSAAPMTPARPSESDALPDGPAATDLAEAVFSVSGCEEPKTVERINAGEDAGDLDFYMENAYGLEEGEWEDAAIIRATGASAFEVAVLRFPDEDAAGRAAAYLAEYQKGREGDFIGYAPEQADMVHNGSVSHSGPWVGLFLCPDPGTAESAFTAALEGRELPLPDVPSETPEPTSPEPPSETPEPAPPEPPSETPEPAPSETPEPTPTETSSETPPPSESPAGVQYPGRVSFIPPNKDDMSIYDTSAIRYAWAAGDPSGLSDYDRAIYDAAQAILAQSLLEGMSDYEKEVALYQWIVQHVNYDWTHNNVMVPTPRESFTPYGGLVKEFAVCLGFATAFQLLMDLAGVECITVAGAGNYSTEDHAWNMVRLNGNWYCVDVTWDANRRQDGRTQGWPSQWRYFNVTSDYMAAEHQWDYANIPEAVTEGNGK